MTLKKVKISDFIIIFLIIIIQLIYQNNRSIVPEGLTEIYLFSYKIGHFGFGDMNFIFWLVLTKLLVIIPSIIWFLTCNRWWRYSILIIVAIEITKLVSLLNTNLPRYDEIEFITSLPITLPIIILLFLISKLIDRHNRIIELNEIINYEIDFTFNQIKKNESIELKTIHKKYSLLQKEKSKISNGEYLIKLKGMRDMIYKF